MPQHTPVIRRSRGCPRSGVRGVGQRETRIARERLFIFVVARVRAPLTTTRGSPREQLENVVKAQSNWATKFFDDDHGPASPSARLRLLLLRRRSSVMSP